MTEVDQFAHSLLRWYRLHGRRGLPWLDDRDPYRIWVSEIMLQQTQVTTVVPYYQKFIERFPDARALAAASVDSVLGLWSGLGYYARARNLHRAAEIIATQHGGVFPDDYDQVLALPGIGRSTAAAILAFAHGQRRAILDGNVKRVLARYHAVEGWPGQSAVARRLWALAETHLPASDVRAYTQAIMDLGAMVCRLKHPDCGVCPLTRDCQARMTQRVDLYPGRRPKKRRPRHSIVFIMIRDRVGRVLLEHRPPHGSWGGLWSFPEWPADVSLASWSKERFGTVVQFAAPWPRVRHGFTHFELDITPQPASAPRRLPVRMRGNGVLWYKPGAPFNGGLAGPVRALLQQMEADQ